MAITYPLTLPASPSPRFQPTILPQSAVGAARSPFTFQEQMQVHQGQRWTLSLEYPPLPLGGDAASAIEAFLVGLNGREGTFLAGPRVAARGAATGTPLVKGADQTGETLVTDGWTAGVTGILKANDWFSLGTGAATRLYKLRADADSDGSGEAALAIWPNLRGAPADNAPLEVAAPKGLWRLASNEISISRDHVFLYASIEAGEAL